MYVYAYAVKNQGRECQPNRIEFGCATNVAEFDSDDGVMLHHCSKSNSMIGHATIMATPFISCCIYHCSTNRFPTWSQGA
ncbi:hypothetical protein V6N13_060318 [Hibiscus sabdariffa]